jgi:hypothetical protein
MTVIAYDGKMIAADGLGTGSFNHAVTKLFNVAHYLIGVAGRTDDAFAFVDWFRELKEGTRYPYPKNLGEDFIALVVDYDGHAVRYWEKHPFPLPVKAPYAIGSGDVVAITAMHCGKNAKEAVQLACKLVSYCGGEIQVVTLEDIRRAADSWKSSHVAQKSAIIQHERANNAWKRTPNPPNDRTDPTAKP